MLDTRTIEDITVVRLKKGDRLNAVIAEEVKQQLVEMFSKSKMKLVFDLRGITFIDSSGFGIFLATLKAANNHYGQFKICHVSNELMELFKLLQLHHVFEIYDELNPCLSSFNP